MLTGRTKLLNAEIVIVHAFCDVRFHAMICQRVFFKGLLVVRRFHAVRLDDAEHIFHHAVRLQLTRKALVHANQTIFVVNVEAAQLGVSFDVPAMDSNSVCETFRFVFRKDVIFFRQSRDWTARNNLLAAQVERASRSQVKNLHIGLHGVIFGNVCRRELTVSILLKDRASMLARIFCRVVRDADIIPSAKVELVEMRVFVFALS